MSEAAPMDTDERSVKPHTSGRRKHDKTTKATDKHAKRRRRDEEQSAGAAKEHKSRSRPSRRAAPKASMKELPSESEDESEAAPPSPKHKHKRVSKGSRRGEGRLRKPRAADDEEYEEDRSDEADEVSDGGEHQSRTKSKRRQRGSDTEEEKDQPNDEDGSEAMNDDDGANASEGDRDTLDVPRPDAWWRKNGGFYDLTKMRHDPLISVRQKHEPFGKLVSEEDLLGAYVEAAPSAAKLYEQVQVETRGKAAAKKGTSEKELRAQARAEWKAATAETKEKYQELQKQAVADRKLWLQEQAPEGLLLSLYLLEAGKKVEHILSKRTSVTTSYNMFRREYAQEHGDLKNMTLSDRCKTISAAWQAMTTKEKFPYDLKAVTSMCELYDSLKGDDSKHMGHKVEQVKKRILSKMNTIHKGFMEYFQKKSDPEKAADHYMRKLPYYSWWQTKHELQKAKRAAAELRAEEKARRQAAKQANKAHKASKKKRKRSDGAEDEDEEDEEDEDDEASEDEEDDEDADEDKDDEGHVAKEDGDDHRRRRKKDKAAAPETPQETRQHTHKRHREPGPEVPLPEERKAKREGAGHTKHRHRTAKHSSRSRSRSPVKPHKERGSKNKPRSRSRSRSRAKSRSRSRSNSARPEGRTTHADRSNKHRSDHRRRTDRSNQDQRRRERERKHKPSVHESHDDEGPTAGRKRRREKSPVAEVNATGADKNTTAQADHGLPRDEAPESVKAKARKTDKHTSVADAKSQDGAEPDHDGVSAAGARSAADRDTKARSAADSRDHAQSGAKVRAATRATAKPKLNIHAVDDEQDPKALPEDEEDLESSQASSAVDHDKSKSKAEQKKPAAKTGGETTATQAMDDDLVDYDEDDEPKPMQT